MITKTKIIITLLILIQIVLFAMLVISGNGIFAIAIGLLSIIILIMQIPKEKKE